MQVFGYGTDQIDDVATTTGVSQMANSTVLYFCATAGNWYTEGLASGFVRGASLQTTSAQNVTASSSGIQGGGLSPRISRRSLRVVRRIPYPADRGRGSDRRACTRPDTPPTSFRRLAMPSMARALTLPSVLAPLSPRCLPAPRGDSGTPYRAFLVKLSRGSLVARHLPHTQVHDGSIPSPATLRQSAGTSALWARTIWPR